MTRQQATLVLPIVGLEGSTISSSKNPIFSPGGTSNADHLILTSSKYFQSAVVPGGRNSNSPPSAIPARCTLLSLRIWHLFFNKKNLNLTYENCTSIR